MEIAQIFENRPKGKIYSIIGNVTINTNNINYSIITGYTFNNTVKSFLNSDKDIQSLKMVILSELYLDKTVNELSDMEIKKIVLAKALIKNKDYIVLDYFEKGLSSKEKDNFKRFFKMLLLSELYLDKTVNELSDM